MVRLLVYCIMTEVVVVFLKYVCIGMNFKFHG